MKHLNTPEVHLVQGLMLPILLIGLYVGPSFTAQNLLFNSPEANRAIYEAKSNVKKGSFYLTFALKAGALNTANSNHAEHARKRRILNAAFSNKALRTSEPYVIQHVDRWCQLLVDAAGHEWSQPRDMAEWSDYLVFDILGMPVLQHATLLREQDQQSLNRFCDARI
ncbi:MAG: hypothetical protein L6R38_007149 [Xanthoria sp. 2 TBL-2021]|nr:MAG: hypothetical protein L6R38_007149 [Xanthoria sp. 2 TBL-2021]